MPDLKTIDKEVCDELSFYMIKGVHYWQTQNPKKAFRTVELMIACQCVISYFHSDADKTIKKAIVEHIAGLSPKAREALRTVYC